MIFSTTTIWIKEYFRETGKLSDFTFRFFRELFKPPFEWKEMLRQAYLLGYQSFFLVRMTAFIMGVVLTLQSRPIMMEFGAELGSMRVTEQIDAMEVSGTNPFKYLVVARVVAITLMLPLLTICADVFSLLGSWLVENTKGDITLTLFFNLIFDSLEFVDVIPSTIKTFFFGFIIGIV